MTHIGLSLKDIFFNRRSGRLSLRLRDAFKYFFFEEGELVGLKSNVPEERLEDFLLKNRKLSSQAYSELFNSLGPGQNTSEVLLAKGLLSPAEIRESLTGLMTETVLNSFRYFEAEIFFQERDLAAGEKLADGIPVIGLIEQGIRQMDHHPALVDMMSRKIPVLKGVQYLKSLMEKEKTIFEYIDGRSSTQVLSVRTGVHPEFFWKSIYLFHCLDLIALADEIPPPAREQEKQPFSEAEEVELSEVMAISENLASLNYYQILRVSRDPSEADLKKAYFQLAKKFHPDRFKRDLTKKSKEQIVAVFDTVTKAYRTLSNPEQRKNYDARVTDFFKGEEKNVAKRADVKFRQAKTLFQQERYQEAIVFLEEAIRLNRNKSDFYLLLALAESKTPSLLRKAEEDFLKVISLEAWNPEGYIGLGLLYKNEGLSLKASKQFKKALEVDPEHKMARQELEQMGMLKEKKGLAALFSKGIFGKKK